MSLDRAECRRICRRKGSKRLTVGGVSREGLDGGVALWTFCSSDWPLRKLSVPSGAGTGRLHLERYQVFKNKGMCFPLAADLSTEIFLLQSCKCFHPGCWEGVSNFLSYLWVISCVSWLAYCVCEKECVEEKMRGKCVSTNVLECASVCVLHMLWGRSTER